MNKEQQIKERVGLIANHNCTLGALNYCECITWAREIETLREESAEEIEILIDDYIEMQKHSHYDRR